MVKEIDHIQLLRTKLHQPPIPVDHVRRVGILARLKKEANRSAILISAPAGYGKSTLVASWLAECGCCWSYVSLDEGDNTPSRLLGCIVAAVRTAVPDSIPDTLALLEAPNLPPTAIVATTLLNEVEKLGQNLLIALDDVHCLKDPAALEILDLLLRQPSPYLRFILIGRRDPALPIASLRASGMLTEIRMRDLRFSAEETTEFLRATTGQPADALAAANLVEKTEGWVTGLRLAGLAVAGRDDIKSRFLELKGTSSYILDFLVAEVLDRQPPEVRDLLLATSVLGRFCAPLCDALREQSGGEAPERLDGLEFITWLRSNNLFIIPLDTENRWFRYHHLFQDLLKHQLALKISPEEIAELHLRACAWCEQEGLIEEAIQLALSVGDPETAADIVERHCEAHYDQNRWYVVDRWLESLPTEIKQQRPHLLLTEARLLNDRFRLAEIPAVVEQARALLEARPGAVLDHAELNYFHGFLQYWGGDGPTSLACLEKALEALPEDHHGYVRAQVELFVGLATQFCGRPEEAIGRLKGWIKDRSLRSGLLWERLQFGLITIHLVDGNLPAAHREGRVFLDDGRRTGQAFIASWANYLLGTVAFHEFDIEGVRSHFCEVAEHRYSANTRAAVDSMAGLAIAAELAGRPEQAEPWLVQARELAGWANDSSLDMVIQATEARIALLRGDLETAARWQRSFDMPVDAPSMIFFLVNPCITECRVLTALGTESSLRAAEHKLAEVRTAVEKVHNRLQVVDVMALQALTATQQGRRSLALDLLQETLELAVPRGWLRPFVELGQPLANLLQDLKASDRAVDLVDSILAAIPGTAHRTAAASQLIEPLSHRELDVLELLAKRMQNKEIGETLSISPGTVKAHLRTIYQKLDVANRREAALKAKRLRLVE